jgi:hypothetical protein
MLLPDHPDSCSEPARHGIPRDVVDETHVTQPTRLPRVNHRLTCVRRAFSRLVQRRATTLTHVNAKATQCVRQCCGSRSAHQMALHFNWPCIRWLAIL